jgi:YD repeat-containing protein
VTYGYDLTGRVISVSDNGASLGPVSQSASLTATAGYDALNRPVSVGWSPAAIQTTPAASASAIFTHSYDATNLRVGQAVNDNSWLSYPGPARSTAYSTNALNQYSQVGSVTPGYDANGNLTFDGTFTYGYDAENRLVSVAQGNTAVASYAYDGRGRRKSRIAGGSTTVYVTGAEDQELVEYNGTTGSVGAFYAFNPGGGIDAVLNGVGAQIVGARGWVGRWSRMLDTPPAPETMMRQCLTSIMSRAVTGSRRLGTGWRTGGSTTPRCATAAA